MKMVKYYRVVPYINDVEQSGSIFESYSFDKSVEIMNKANSNSHEGVEYKVLEYDKDYMIFNLTQTSHDHHDDTLIKIHDLNDLLAFVEACEEEVIIYKHRLNFGTNDNSTKDMWTLEIYDDYRE